MKTANKRFRLFSFILCAVMLLSCFSAGNSLVSAEEYDDIFNGGWNRKCYDDTAFAVSSSAWANVTYKKKIDVTKGFYIRSSNKVNVRLCSEVGSSWDDMWRMFTITESEAGKTFFVKVDFDKANNRYIVNRREIGGNTNESASISVENFEALNHKIAGSETFEGGYILFQPEHEILVEFALPTDGKFTGLNFSKDVTQRDTLSFGSQGYASSVNRYDLLSGIEFKLSGLADSWVDDYVRMGFSSDYIGIRSESYSQSRGGTPFPLKFMNSNGRLAVSYYGASDYSEWQKLDTPLTANHTVKAFEDNGAYSFAVDGVKIDGYSVSADDFNKMNSNGGAYIGLYSQQADSVVGDIAALPPIQKNFYRAQNGFVNFTSQNWVGTSSDYRVDLRKGISFKFPDGLSAKTDVLFGSYKITFKTDNGVYINDTNGTCSTLDFTNQYHTLWAKKQNEGYEWYIDNIATGITINDNDFKLMNGYSNISQDFDGAYFTVFSENGTVKMSLSVLPGDLNCSGAVDAVDLAMLRKYLLGIEQTGVTRANLFVNADSEVDILDLVAMKKITTADSIAK